MSDVAIGALCLAGSLVLIQSGMNIGVALMLLSFVGVLAIKGVAVAGKLLASSVATSIASDAYAVIPLFVLMGLFVSATNMGRDTFDVAARLLRGLRGGLGIATVAANAVFAACTGTTIASASVFTKVAVPEMMRHGYTPQFSVGVVAGSSVLGMLIPPSILMIIFGVIANVSIADLFTSGIVPGILLAAAFCGMIMLLAYFRPQFVGVRPEGVAGRVCRAARPRAGLAAGRQVSSHRIAGRDRARRHLRRLLHADRGGRRGRAGGVPDRAGAARADPQDLLGSRAGGGARDRRDLLSADGGGALLADADALRACPMRSANGWRPARSDSSRCCSATSPSSSCLAAFSIRSRSC